MSLPDRLDPRSFVSASGVTTSLDTPEVPGSDPFAEPVSGPAAAALIRRLNRALDPDFVVVRLLGGGGMGFVFLARDTALDRVVAIKAIRPELATEAAVQRFLREARILARIRHSNIIPIHRAGSADGLPYYVMEHVEGETLADRLRRGPMSDREAIGIGQALLDALAAAHAAGVVHRDVKPANIFLTGGRVLLGDFGVASIRSRDPEATTTSGRVGTPAYMPPEQATTGDATERSDGYAAGMVIYEMLTGRRWVPTAHPTETDWSGVKRRFRAPLRRALAWDPEKRWGRVSAFRQALYPRHRVMRRVAVSGWLVAATVVVAAIVLQWWSQRSPLVPADADLAILPFDVLPNRNPELGENFGSLISHYLPDVPRMRRRPWSSAVRWWNATPESQRSDGTTLCRSIRARLCTKGTILTDGDNLIVTLDVLNDAGLVEWHREFRGSIGDLYGLAGEAAAWLVAELPERFPGTLRSLSDLSNDLEAVELYFQGEHAFNSDQPQLAIDRYREALERDPTFALARWHLVNALRWMPGQTPDLQPHLEQLAARSAGRLAALDSMLVLAQLLPPGPERLRAYALAAQAYPLDAFPRMLLGEELFHRGPLSGSAFDTAAVVLEEAVALDSLFAPTHELLAWHHIRNGNAERAERSLTALDSILIRGSPASQQYAALLEHAYLERFDPIRARAARVTAMQSDPLTRWDPGFALRMPFAFDMPGVQAEFGETLTRSEIASERANGYYGKALADAVRGRGAEALGHLDSATALLGADSAELHAAEWRVIPAALGLPLFDGSERQEGRLALERLVEEPAVAARAAWALALDAAASALPDEAHRWRDRLAAAHTESGGGLHAMLEAQELALQGNLDSALVVSQPLLVDDAHDNHGDPFARSVLHVLRAGWYTQLGDADATERELRWAENLDIVGWPGDQPQAVEIDWMLSVHASYKRAGNALATGNRDLLCAELARVVAFWDATDDVLRDWSESARQRHRNCPP